MRVLAALVLLASVAHAEPTYFHVELDPLPFANSGYGGQIGVRHPALRGVRLAVASFSLHVPDVITELGGNDGWDQTVLPSAALYVLYYPRRAGRDGFSVGGSFRYLRYRFFHDDMPASTVTIGEITPEAIVGYQWHPFKNGFYLQPWFALGISLWRNREPAVNGRTYESLPISPFFTVNIGYEHGL
jgi:hypothetical protein